MLEKELEAAISLARGAGGRILTHYALDIIAEQKFDADNVSEPVTIADKEASRIIVDGLHREFPGDSVLSEEEPDSPEERLSRNRVWIIDPIDGTWGFVKKDGDFAVQIGLAENGKPILGVVFVPVHNLLYYATTGQGTFIVDSSEKTRQMHVSEKTDFDSIAIATSRNHRNPRMARVNQHLGIKTEIRRGSIGLKLGLIAERECDLYINLSSKSKFWDTCGPQIILEEAGGKFTDLFGQEFRYDLKDVRNHNGIVASNGASHEKTVEKLRPLLTEFGRHKVKATAGA